MDERAQNGRHHEPVQGWEYIFDAVLLAGAFVLVWFALHVAGLQPPVPVLRFDPEIHDHLRYTIYVLAVVGVSEYVMLQFLVTRTNRDQLGNPLPWTVRRRALFRAAFAAGEWIYILMLYILLQKGQ